MGHKQATLRKVRAEDSVMLASFPVRARVQPFKSFRIYTSTFELVMATMISRRRPSHAVTESKILIQCIQPCRAGTRKDHQQLVCGAHASRRGIHSYVAVCPRGYVSSVATYK